MLAKGEDPEFARAVTTYLAFAVDKVVDRNSSFASWQPQEKVRNTFTGQTAQMRWDFCEIDPFQKVSGSWDSSVDWIRRVINHCTEASSTPASRVLRADAQRLPLPDDHFDAVVIDPPYYYSVMYSDLSDLFYVWLKRSVGHLYPADFVAQWTPKSQEIIQNRVRPSHERHISGDEFERRLQHALGEIARVVKPDGVVTIVFAHTDLAAWERLLTGLRAAGLIVTTSWPMRSEMKGRPVAHVKAALGSSVVLVCRRSDATGEAYYDDVVRDLDTHLRDRLATFDDMGLVGADYFASAIGPAFEVFARHRHVLRLSGDEVSVGDLMILARQIVARHAMERLLGDRSVASLDNVSLLYMTWRWAYLTAEVPADDVFKLERAFDVDIGDLTGRAGLFDKKASKFRLLGPDERRTLDPSTARTKIDVLHLACRYWADGRRNELVELLAASGMGDDDGFWALATALAEVLPDGEKERTMLLGLTGRRDDISRDVAAAKPSEQMDLGFLT